jgi:hypothetical protein
MKKQLILISPLGERLTIKESQWSFGSVKVPGDDYSHIILESGDEPDIGMTMTAGLPQGFSIASIESTETLREPFTLSKAKIALAKLKDGERKFIVLGSQNDG